MMLAPHSPATDVASVPRDSATTVIVGVSPDTPSGAEVAALVGIERRHVYVAHNVQAFVEAAVAATGPVVAAFDRDIVNRMALNRIRNARANSVRIAVLPRGAEQAVNHDCGYAHHFLMSSELTARAFDFALLRALESSTDARMRQMRDILPDDVALPPTPGGLAELLNCLDDPSIAMGEVATVLEQDPVIAARTLQLANSAYFSLPRRVSSLQQAVNLLGLECIKSLALATKCMGAVSAKPDRLVDKCLERVRKSGLAASQLIRKILGARGDGAAVTAAVLHDIGQAVMMKQHRRKYADVLKRAEQEQRPLVRLEEEAFGVSHAQIGGALLASWGLPAVLVEPVAFSHAVLPHPTQGMSPLAVTYLATRVSEESQLGLQESEVPAGWAEACGFVDQLAPQLWRDAADEIQMKWPGG